VLLLFAFSALRRNWFSQLSLWSQLTALVAEKGTVFPAVTVIFDLFL